MRFLVRPGLENLPSYTPGKPIEELKRETGADPISKLASNENPLGPSPAAVAAIAWAAADAHRYPDAAAFELKAALATHIGLSVDSITVGNGSDELIQTIALSLLTSGDESVLGVPTFPRYETATQIAGGNVVRVPVDSCFRLDLDLMAEAITDRTRIVWIANPNNPTGTLITRAELDRFLSRLPDHVAVVLDEAYHEFVESEDAPNAAEYVKSGANVIGLRTLSKTFGLAGLRVGYAFCDASLCSVLDRVRGPFNVNLLAQVAAKAALGDSEFMRDSLTFNRHAVKRLHEILSRFGFSTTESHTNFVWADLGRPSQPVCDALLNQGVIVRGGAIFGFPNSVRVSTGTDAQLDHLERALVSAMAGARA